MDDTLLADSLPEDTVDYTARFLEAQQQVAVRTPVLPVLAPPGPRPAFTRTVFTRDSIEWGHAVTVGDLLTQIPGVYLWRGGFIGRPEPVNFQARGATSAEYYLDGLPYVAAGIDSVAVDPALFSISFLDRIEVERWPGLLRVHLFTRRHDRVAPRSRIGIARGDDDYARYEGSLERRFANGVGFAAAADYLNSPTASGSTSGYSNTQFWLQGHYIPNSRVGFQYQLVRSSPERDPFVNALPVPNDTIGAGFDASRTDAQLRASWRARDDGMGPRIEALYGRTGWDGAGIDQQINQVGGGLGYRTPVFSVGASAYHRTRWTALDVRGTAGWNPVPAVAATVEAVHQRHYGGRNSNYVFLAGGLQPVRGLVADRIRPIRRRGRRAVHHRRHRARSQGLRGRRRVGARAAGPPALVQPHVRVQSVRLRRISPHREHRRGAGDRVGHGPGPPRAAPLADARWLVQRSPRHHARGHPADPFGRGVHAAIEVPAPVSQRDLRPQAAPRAWNRGGPG